MELVAGWVVDSEAEDRTPRHAPTLAVLAISLGLMALPPVVGILVLLGVVS
jgi:hypothetical protein